MSILNQIYMISDVGCHKLFLWATVLFHRNCDCLVPEMFMFCSAVLFSLKKNQQNNYLCPAGDERSGVFCCWWQLEFAIFAEQLIPSLKWALLSTTKKTKTLQLLQLSGSKKLCINQLNRENFHSTTFASAYTMWFCHEICFMSLLFLQ